MTSSQNTAGHIDVSIVPHPFAVERVRHCLPDGGSIAEILDTVQPDASFARQAHIYLNGDYIPRDKYRSLRPKPGTTLTIRMVPMGGGGGKNPLRTILSIAIIAASPALAAGFASTLGVTAQTSFLGLSAGRLLTTGINLLGRLALNALAPPGSPRFSADAKESPTLFIQGARNQVTPFGRVPKVLGRHRMVPPFGALPYTETIGDDQYLRLLFVWGYGPLNITDLKIGETPLSEFTGVEIETRQGYDDDAPLTLYSNSVLQNDMDIALKQSAGYILRTTESSADEISVDVTLPRGLLKFDGKGKKAPTTLQVEVQYSKTGLNDWSAGAQSFKSIAAQSVAGLARPSAYQTGGVARETICFYRIVLDRAAGTPLLLKGADFHSGIDQGAPEVPSVPFGYLPLARIERRSGDTAVIPAGRITDERVSPFQSAGNFLVLAAGAPDTVSLAAGGLKFEGLLLTAKQSSALRKSVSFKVPRGQYDLRLRRITPDAVDDNTFDEANWSAIRTLRAVHPVRMTGLAMTAMRIRATDQLSGVVERFNGVVQSILPDWNGTGWAVQPTSNPAALFRHILQGKGNARPLADARLDLDRLVEWHMACAAENRSFNAVIDYDVSVREVLQDVAAAGRASPTLLDGKWAVVQDRVQTVPVQHFTPRNTFGFQGQKAFDDLPQALRVRFINRDKGWLQDERLVFDDGYDETTAQRYEKIDMTGITDTDQAWRCGRYHIATARLRPETYSFNCDIEHIVCTRGDLIRFTHDVPLFGLASARVKSLLSSGGFVTGVTLDETLEMQDGRSYAARFRKTDGASLSLPLASFTGATSQVLFVTPIPAGSAPAPGNLVLFGESGQESVELIVKSIEPQNNLNARITCVDAAPGIHLADKGVIPPFNSQISLPPSLQRPPVPVLAQIQSGEEALVRNTDGSLSTRVLITLAPPSFPVPLTPRLSIRATGETEFRAAEFTVLSATRLVLLDVSEGETCDIQIRYVTENGVFSAPLLIPNYRVDGTVGQPSDITGFMINIAGATAHFSWNAVPDADLSHYILRFCPQLAGASWGQATDIAPHIARDATSFSAPAIVGTYFIKAVDIGGRQGANAASALSSVLDISGFNAVLTVSEDDEFTGSMTHICLNDGLLQLAARAAMDIWSDVDLVPNTDAGEGGLEQNGIYDFAETVDLGAVYTSRLTADIAADGVDFNNTVDMFGNIDITADMDKVTDPSSWSLQLQLRSCQGDPDDLPDWSPWSNIFVGDYTARAYQFRLLFSSQDDNVTPSVSRLRVGIDMPDRTQSGRSIISDLGGSVVLFDRAFRAPPAVAVTARDMAGGDYYTIAEVAAEGFTIRFFDIAGYAVTRTFDYLAKGYGEQI